MADLDIPTEALEAAARALYNLGKTPGINWWAGSVTEDTRALTAIHAEEGCWYTVSQATVDCQCGVYVRGATSCEERQ